MSLPNAVFFGASTAGQAYLENSRDTYTVVAFVDRDPAKQGTSHAGVPVLAPEALAELDFDVVVITSSYITSIRETLRADFGLSDEQIVTPPKSQMKIGGSVEPFRDDATRAFARELIIELCAAFAAQNITVFLDHGTLLGLVRDGDLIAWDDDIDLTVLAEHLDAAHGVVLGLLPDLDARTGTPWTVVPVRDGSGDLRAFILEFSRPGAAGLAPFGLAVEGLRFIDGQAVATITTAPEAFFRSQSRIEAWGASLPVPADVEAYLSFHYGDWRTPQPGFRFGDIKNHLDPSW